MEREVEEMSRKTSPSTNKIYGLKRVCVAWEICRSAIYARRKRQGQTTIRSKRGPKPRVSDKEVLNAVRQDLINSPFKGEGHRKVHARIRRNGTIVGKNRVLHIMRNENLLSPYRSPQGEPNTHDGRITTDQPNEMWGTDAIKINTIEDGMVWGYFAIEHWNAECMGWPVCKYGDAQASLEPIKQGVKRIYGNIQAQVATGLTLREDHGTQYTADEYRKQLKFWDIKISYGYVGEPETNGVVERFNRTLKEQVVHGRIFRNIAEVREFIGKFIELYNKEWLLEKLKYKCPMEVREEYEQLRAAS